MKNEVTKEKALSKKNENSLYIFILIAFIVLVSIVSLKHEYWADEANAWLIAADSSIVQLFTKYLHVDGHPALFHLIIKLFQFLGLDYANFRIISILFSSLGIGYFLFKSNYKWYLKALLPFTYFLFYQYSVITRGYCLILLLLSLIADIWDKKKEKCILFTILTILLLSLESYTFFIAGSIYLIYILEYIKDYRETKKHNKKLFICLVVLFISFLITTIYVMPRSENTFNPSMSSYYISDSFITPFNVSDGFKTFFCVFVVFVLGCIIYKNRKNIVETMIFIVPLLCFMSFKYCNLWHTGIMFLLFLFIGWIYEYYKIKLFNIFMFLVCIIQVYWSIDTSIYDYKESYTPAKEVADFIKKYDYKHMKIYGVEFYESAINAYFDENIFDNWHDTRFFYWSKNNIYYKIPLDVDSLLRENVDMIIVTPLYEDVDFSGLEKYYDVYYFFGYTYFQVDKYENMETVVYIRKANQVEA